jgi:hypothetical protein
MQLLPSPFQKQVDLIASDNSKSRSQSHFQIPFSTGKRIPYSLSQAANANPRVNAEQETIAILAVRESKFHSFRNRSANARGRIRGAYTNVVLALEHMELGALIISLSDFQGVFEQ